MMGLLCFVLFLCALCTSTVAINNPHVINSMDDFWVMYDSANNGTFSFDVDLRCDLNFSNQTRSFENPLGYKASDETPYNGVFDGHNHAIFGLTIVQSKYPSSAAFFASIGNATIRNLRFDSSCLFDGAWAGALACQTDSGSYVHLVNVHNAATVRGVGSAGGLIGWAFSRQVIMESCTNAGYVTTSGFNLVYGATGGLVGWMNSKNVTITNCHNMGRVLFSVKVCIPTIETPHAGGIIGQASLKPQTSMVIDSCTNTGDVIVAIENDTATLIPNASANGIMSFSPAMQSNITIRNCHNSGTISVASNSQNVNTFASGIATLCVDHAPSGMLLNITGCTNRGNVTTSGTPTVTYSAGIVSSTFRCTLRIESCMNRGFVTSTNQSAGITFIATSIENSVNNGIVNGSHSFAIARVTDQLDHVVSIGDLIWSEKSYATVEYASGAMNLFYRQGILAKNKNGRVIFWNNSRWIIKDHMQ